MAPQTSTRSSLVRVNKRVNIRLSAKSFIPAYVSSVQDIARPGQTISSLNYEEKPGGKGANQAVAVRRAGQPVTLAACFGASPEGWSWHNHLSNEYDLNTRGDMGEVC